MSQRPFWFCAGLVWWRSHPAYAASSIRSFWKSFSSMWWDVVGRRLTGGCCLSPCYCFCCLINLRIQVLLLLVPLVSPLVRLFPGVPVQGLLLASRLFVAFLLLVLQWLVAFLLLVLQWLVVFL